MKTGCDAPDPDATPILMTLTATQCFGSCPAYSVRVHESGQMAWCGTAYVKVRGSAFSTLDKAHLDDLRGAFTASGFEGLTSPERSCTDTPTMTLAYGGHETHDAFCSREPQALHRLEERVQDLLGVRRWIGPEDERTP